jgi:light-regulated signal transduction histidine kinase (bacteriophytochrome)/CheY-like chemotaxis protein
VPASPRHTKAERRFPAAIQQSPVSMFTGLTQQPTALQSRTDNHLSAMSPSTIDRVFPVRSAVSIDPTATPAPRQETSNGFPGMNLHLDSAIAERRQKHSESARPSSVSSGGRRSPTPDRKKRTSSGRISGSTDLANANEGKSPANENARRSSVASAKASNTKRVDTQFDNQQLSKLLSDTASNKSNGTSITDGGGSTDGGMSVGGRPSSIKSVEEPGPGLITARFKHAVTEGGHSVITGRDGEILQRCEDEPIHIPGAVQGFGLLIAFKEDAGKLVVRVVSENASRIIGYTPAQLFRLESFLDIFTEEQADNLSDHLDFIRDDDAADVVVNGPEVFMISLRPPHQRTKKLWCAMHICESDHDMVICEFEVEDDHVNPLVHAEDTTPEPPEDTLGAEPTPEQYAESTTNISKPLRVLRSARKKRGEAAAMEVFNIMSQVQEQLASATTLPIFLRVLIGVVKELTGFHRVMIYQFDQTWNGRVVAELVDPRATKDMYKGLNFPASDIPKQARDLYKVNKVRLLYDRDQETARLVCRTTEDLEKPLDLTHAYLRAMSPIHIKYLSNMAVRASMSISINAFNELWGLVACHAYGSKGMRVSFPIRKMCRLVGDTASRNIERLSYASRLQARKLINTSSSSVNPSGYIVASSDDLLKLFDADVGALSICDETKIMGKQQQHLQEILAMVEYLRLRKLTSVYASQDINNDFPDLRYAPGLKFLAGLLYVPLSHAGADFIVFFRRGFLQEVKWAGNPYEKFVKEGTDGYLEPRKSFKTWSETIIGRCRDWSTEEIETASVLCLVYGKFIDVWRQKEVALQNSQLTRLLLANSAHEVRTPLNAIINYLEIALEGQLDQDTRENLTKSHSASKSLVYVINDLLDLTKTEDGQDLIKEDPFDLKATLDEASNPFIGEAKRKNIDYSVRIADDIPRVIGDHRRLRQIVSNLVANAIQHTTTGGVTLEASKSAEQPSAEKVDIEIAVEDTGAGMSQSKVDALFQELEEVSYEIDKSLALVEKNTSIDKNKDDKALGLGLAVVARTIRNMNGQLRLKTEEGKGSRFVIQLTFDLESPPHQGKHVGWQQLAAAQASSTGAISPPTTEDGGYMLVKRNSASIKRPASSSLVRRTSRESVQSLKSMQSQGSYQSGASQKSDVDRLIDAIQEPVLASPTEHSHSRGNSRERHLSRSGSLGQEELSRGQMRPKSVGSTRDLKSSLAKVPGEQKVKDSGTPIKAVKLDHDYVDNNGSPSGKRSGTKVFFQQQGTVAELSDSFTTDRTQNVSTENFRILVAEDDPINSRIIQKRLEKLGHRVQLTVNGEECSSAHGDHAASYDAILMDLQMPIVDGFTSTKMIRSFEKTSKSSNSLSARACPNGRIPIFAVSASLVEREREKYIEAGFDGWILKPIDFKRTEMLLKGIVDEEIREQCIYTPGKWEQGGWFSRREKQIPVAEIDTTPSQSRRPASTHSGEGDSGSDTTQRPLFQRDGVSIHSGVSQGS